MKRVCLMRDTSRGHAVIIGERFRPSQEDTHRLQTAGLLKGIRTVTVGSTTGPFPDEGRLPHAVGLWAANYKEKLDATRMVWEIINLTALSMPRPVPRISRTRSKVYVCDPNKVLQAFAPEAPSQVEANPDLEHTLAQLPDPVVQAAYLEPFFFHPDAPVRVRAANLSVPVSGLQIDAFLVHLLADAEDGVSEAAAKALWARERSSHCAAAILALRNEFQAEGVLALGPSGARTALKALVAAAPDETALEGVVAHIAREIPSDADKGNFLSPEQRKILAARIAERSRKGTTSAVPNNPPP